MNVTVELDRLEIVNLQADDIIIVTLSALVTPEQVEQVKQQFPDNFPDDRTMVKTNNVGIDIFRSQVA